MKPSLTTPASSARWPNETYASVEVFIVYGVGLSQLQQPETSGRGTSHPQGRADQAPHLEDLRFQGALGRRGRESCGV